MLALPSFSNVPSLTHHACQLNVLLGYENYLRTGDTRVLRTYIDAFWNNTQIRCLNATLGLIDFNAVGGACNGYAI